MQLQFSTRNTLQFMCVVASGLAMAGLQNNWIEDFTRGMLVGFVGLGLIEQVVDRQNSSTFPLKYEVARRGMLSFILVAMAFAIFGLQHPYQLPKNVSFPAPTPLSSFAPILLDLAIMTGMLTVPWMSFSNSIGVAKLTRTIQVANTAATSLLSIILLIIVTPYWLSILLLVDSAINGTQLGRPQSGTNGTPNYLAEVLSSDRQFMSFVSNQSWSWPLLVLATAIATWRSQINSASRLLSALWLAMSIALAAPSISMLIWLLVRVVRQASAATAGSLISEILPDWQLVLVTCMLLAMLLTTRYSEDKRPQSSSAIAEKERTFTNELIIAGWIQLALGTYGVYQTLSSSFRLNRAFLDTLPSIFEIWCYEPRLMLNTLQFIFAVVWICRYHFRNELGQQRWPQAQPRHAIWGPIIAVLFVTVVLTALPYSLSFWNLGPD